MSLALGLLGCGGTAARSTPAQPARSVPIDTRPAEVKGWSIAAPLLAPASEQAVAEFNGRIYVIGGYPPGSIPVNTVQVYDGSANHWEWGPALPVPMHHTMAVASNGKLYVIGGEFEGAGTGRPAQFLSTVYELDTQANSWLQRSPMPTTRSAGGTGVIDGKIYVAGGRPPHGADFAVYDPAADSWRVLPEVPTQRNHLGVGAINGKLYVDGGRFGGGFNSEKTAVLEVYDPAANTWSNGASMPAPRGGVASTVVNGCLFVIGGEGNYADPRGVFDQNEAYDPKTNRWHSLPPMPTPTHGLVGAAVLDGRIHLPGGSVTLGGGTGSVIHQVYRPELNCR